MTNIKLNEHKHTPATDTQAAMTAKAREEAVVTDKKGRALTLKRPEFLAQFQLAEVLGDAPDRYMQMVLPVLYVAAIDGDAVLKPATKREVEAILKRLDAHGYSAVAAGIAEHLNEDAADDRETVKN